MVQQVIGSDTHQHKTGKGFLSESVIAFKKLKRMFTKNKKASKGSTDNLQSKSAKRSQSKERDSDKELAH